MKLASLFDGIGGALLCAKRCGIKAVWSSEIEPFPIKVTEYHFPHVKHLGDITKINGADVEPVDIIIGGSPCQDLSVAGLRKGMKHSDFGDEETTRSGLFMEQIRIVKEMRNATGTTYPRFMVWENVPGAFSSNNGDDFRAVLEETARVSDSTISIPRSPNGWANSGSILGDGFSISWRTIDAQYWGVPQRRRRIYLVADFGGQSAPEILFERESVRGDIKKSGTEGKGIAGNVENRADETIAVATKQFSQNISYGKANPLCADDYKEPQVICLQGNGIDRADTAGCNGKGWTEDICYTLNTIDRPAVCFEPRSPDGYPRISNDGLCPTLNTMAGGQRQPCIAYDIGNGQADQDLSEEIAGTLNCMHDQRAIMTKNAFGEDVCGTLMARDYKGIGRADTWDRMMNQNNTVRRLTPLECERLQGYPDGWTDIKSGEEPNETKIPFWVSVFASWCSLLKISPKSIKWIKKWFMKPADDGERYKALGNSFAVPCAEFVIRGIKEALEKCN